MPLDAAETNPKISAEDLALKARSFDDAAMREVASEPPVTLEASMKRLGHLIDLLPQRDAIQEHHIKSWIERSLAMAEERMKIETGSALLADVHAHVFWHVRRASGIGGSEAGTVLKHYRGKRGTFSDAHNLVLEKLLVLSPKPGKPEMSRGIRAEPWLQRMYLEKTKARTDHEGLSRLKGFRWDKRPSMIGTPDDLVFTLEGFKRIIDYKAPSADVCEEYEKNGISFDYVCQLHHYGIISMAGGLKFKDMEIQVFDPRFFDLTSYPVPFDRDLAKEMVQASHRIWIDHVMIGVAPDAPKPDDLAVEDPGLLRIGAQAAMFKVIEDQAKAAKNDLISRISMMGTEWHDKATGKMTLPVGSFTRQRKWNEEELRDLAIAAGIDPERFEKINEKDIDLNRAGEILSQILSLLDSGEDAASLLAAIKEEGLPRPRALDCDALAGHLEERGIDVMPAAEIGEKFLLTTKKKGPEFERLSLLKDKVSELMESVDEVVTEAAPVIILGEEPDQPEAG